MWRSRPSRPSGWLLVTFVALVCGFAAAYAQIVHSLAALRPPLAEAAAALAVPSWGPPDATVTVTVALDFQCPACWTFYDQIYVPLRARYGDRIRFEYLAFPSAAHPDALHAALAAQCAQEQGLFWPYFDRLFVESDKPGSLSDTTLVADANALGLQGDQFERCLSSQRYLNVVQATSQLSQAYGADGTPYVLVNNQVMPDGFSFSDLTRAVDAARSLNSEGE